MPDSAQDRLYQAQEQRDKTRDEGNISGQILAARACGLAHFDLGQNKLALALLNESESLIRQENLHTDLLPELLGMKGRSHQRMRQFQEALQLYRQAAQVAVEQGLMVAEIRWRGKEARTLLDLEASLEDFKRQSKSLDPAEAQARIRQFEQNFRPELGLPRLEESVMMGRKLLEKGNKEIVAELAEQLSRLANRLRPVDRERAEKLWEETFTLLDGLERADLHQMATVNYALFLQEGRRYYESLTYLEEALFTSRHLKKPFPRQLDLIHRIASVLRESGKGEAAGDRLWEVKEQIQDVRLLASVLDAASNAYFSARSWEKMRESSQALKDLRNRAFEHPGALSPQDLQRMGAQPEGRFRAAMLEAVACKELKAYDDSLEILEKGIQVAMDAGQTGPALTARAQASLAYLEKGDAAKAAQMARELWDEGLRNGLQLRSLGDALITLGDLDAARALRDEGMVSGLDPMALARLNAQLAGAEQSDASEAWRQYWALAEEKKDLGAVAEALEHIRDIHAEGSPVRLEAAWRRLRLIEKVRAQVDDLFSEASWRAITPLYQRFPDFLDDLVEEAFEQNEPGIAIYELERFRSQYLVNQMATRSALWDAGPLDELLNPGRTELPPFISINSQKGYELKDRLLAKIEDRNAFYQARFRFELVQRLELSWSEKRDAAKELDYWSTRAFASGELMTFGEQGLAFPADLNEYLGGVELQVGEGLVFIHVMPDYTLLWTINDQGQVDTSQLTEFRREDEYLLNQEMKAINPDREDRALVWKEQGPKDAFAYLEAQLDRLNQQLAPALVEHLKASGIKRAFLSAGTAITNLPINACPVFQEADIELCFLPSIYALTFSRRERQPRSRELFMVDERDKAAWAKNYLDALRNTMTLVVDPSKSLAYADLEAKAVARISEAYEVHTIDDPAPDKRDLARLASQSEVVHVIGHGTFDNQSPYVSGMYVQQGQEKTARWTVAEVFSEVEAPAGKLVVLSGCETSRVQPNLVSEDISLPAAWLAAGFAAVIGSRWPVDDLSTALLMTDFYDRWIAQKLSVATALRESTQWLKELKQKDVSSHLKALEGIDISELASIETSIKERGEQPFAHPKYWAAFFVAGDGSIQA